MMTRLMKLVVVALIAALVIALAGCGFIAQQATKAAVEGATGVKVDQNGQNVTITGKNGQQATLSSQQGKLPDGLPSDVPAYSGTIKASSAITTDKGTNYTFTIETKDDAATVLAWYKQNLTDKGWTVASTVSTQDGGMVQAKKGDKLNIIATVTKNSETGGNEIAVIADQVK